MARDLRADELLVGPRGRGLCLAVAHRLNRNVWSAWLQAARQPADRSLLEGFLRALAEVDIAPVLTWREASDFFEPVDETVSAAMYWQPPHDTDAISAEPAVVEALVPVAKAVAAAAGTAWWTEPLDVSNLRYTCRFDKEPPIPPSVTGAAEALKQWRDRTVADGVRDGTNRPIDPAAGASGTWWSTPSWPARPVSTTRPLPGLGSVHLVWEEDSFGQRNAAIWTLRAIRRPRVWEIDRPEDWTRLVDRYPLDVTNARRTVWYMATGRDGTWRIPDWAAVAGDYDAVHLTVAGYLASATRPLPLNDRDAATMLAGWNPDQTWWLTGILDTTAPQPEMWRNRDNCGGPPHFAWREAPIT
jgi:hypothetical protein